MDMRTRDKTTTAAAVAGAAVAVGAGAAAAAKLVNRVVGQASALAELMPPPPMHATAPQVVQDVPRTFFADRGTGCDFETRLATLDGEYLTPNDRFFLRSHSPTPRIDVADWRLAVGGSAVRRPFELTYDDLLGMEQVSVTRAIVCAGNGRRMFKDVFGVEGEGAQWRTGAVGVAEWTGVRLRDVLARADLAADARDVMPVGLDEHQGRRPMPVAKAMAADTLLALRMNGDPLPADHGFPARLVVTGWPGAACIKWVGRIEVATEPLYSPWNTIEYVLVGPDYPTGDPELGPPITEMPVMSVLELDWPATLPAGEHVLRGRSYAGEGRVRDVVYRVDEGPWLPAELVPPNIEGAWVRWQFPWVADSGEHHIRVRATDERGRTQPDSVPWNHHGYTFHAVAAHPVVVQ